MDPSTFRIVLTVLAISVCRPAVAQTGACCFDNGFCADLSALECIQFGGDYQGNGTDCNDGLCTPGGACCLVDGTCILETQSGCAATGGDYQGTGTFCAQVNCPDPIGACCFSNGTCIVLATDPCAAAGGTYQGHGTTCGGGICPEPSGACCFGDVSCLDDLVESFCASIGGTFQGGATTCATACTGACCLPSGTCVEENATDCVLVGGTYQGLGVSCVDFECPSLFGACCNLFHGGCEVVSETVCVIMGGTFSGAGTTCEEICPVCPGEGDCFANNGTAGCSQGICCELICALDPFCCESTWDDVCAQLAQENCDPCPCDSDGSGTIDTVDLLEVLGGWGGGSAGDCTGDGVTDVADLLALLGTWGPCE